MLRIASLVLDVWTDSPARLLRDVLYSTVQHRTYSPEKWMLHYRSAKYPLPPMSLLRIGLGVVLYLDERIELFMNPLTEYVVAHFGSMGGN